MKNQDIHADIASIKNLMERSSKFISLSGLSGVMVGVYALIGASIAYKMLYSAPHLTYSNENIFEHDLLLKLVFLALAILILSVITVVGLTIRKAKKTGQGVWNPSSKRLLESLTIPLFTGGLLIAIFIYKGFFGIIAPSCLIFYGLSLFAGSYYTYKDVKWLGIFEIILGLLAALLPGYGLIFWAIGFGVLHILYGSIMHFKYDR